MQEFETLFSKISNEISCRKLTKRDCLLMTLIYLRQYIPMSILSWLFQVSTATVSNVTSKMLDILDNALCIHLQRPKRQTRQENSVQFDDQEVVLVIDGAEQEVHKPSDKKKEQAVYSGKKCYHTFTKLIGVSPKGHIYYLSPSYQGSVSDSAMMVMAENRWFEHLGKKEFLMADKGFKGLNDFHPTIIPHIGDLTVQEQLYNNRVAEIRIVVENAISMVKKWKICSLEFRAQTVHLNDALIYHDKVWRICAALTNWTKMPIR